MLPAQPTNGSYSCCVMAEWPTLDFGPKQERGAAGPFKPGVGLSGAVDSLAARRPVEAPGFSPGIMARSEGPYLSAEGPSVGAAEATLHPTSCPPHPAFPG